MIIVFDTNNYKSRIKYVFMFLGCAFKTALHGGVDLEILDGAMPNPNVKLTSPPVGAGERGEEDERN